MKTLYLTRHAKSSWKHPNLSDFERPLNKRGKHDAPLMGAFLKNNRISPDLILSSPAKRALQTAKILAKELEYPHEKILTNQRIYLADIDTLEDIIQNVTDDFQHLMLIGHNPGLTHLANYLSDARIANIPTTGIAEIHFDVNQWRKIMAMSGKLVSFDYPKKLF